MYEALRARIGEIIGEASILWSETPKGVFRSDRGVELVDEIMTHISSEVKKERNRIIRIIKKDQVDGGEYLISLINQPLNKVEPCTCDGVESACSKCE